MWVLGKPGDLGIKEASNGHGDVTAVSTGPPPVMPLGIPHPGGGVVLWIAAPHRPRFGALPSLLCSSLTRNSSEISITGFYSWGADVFPTFFAHLLGLRLFTSFWSPFAFDLSYAPARLCTSAGVPRSTRAGRGFPLGVYISLAAWWSFSFARAVLVFLRVAHWGGLFPSSAAGGFLSCPLGGTYLLFDAHTFVRTAVCLPPVYCCFVVSWLFDVRARYCGPGRVFQAPFNRRSPQLRSIAFHTAPRIL